MRRTLVDINSFAIYLVEDHPGHKFIAPVIDKGLEGNISLVVLDNVPFRSYWIMTKHWSIDKLEARETIADFINSNHLIEYTGLTRESIITAFDLAERLKHDVYDCYYLAGAIMSNCQSVLTTDTDFEKLCQKVSQLLKITIDYENPVPLDILKRFSEYNT